MVTLSVGMRTPNARVGAALLRCEVAIAVIAESAAALLAKETRSVYRRGQVAWPARRSPLVMAGVAGAVAEGRWRAPRLLASDGHQAGQPIPPADLENLRAMMRDVVTGGTGVALVDLPGEPIGKSGTTEYGSGHPPPMHAWFIAARDGLALAVLAARFLATAH